jgi:hypothetical protein
MVTYLGLLRWSIPKYFIKQTQGNNSVPKSTYPSIMTQYLNTIILKCDLLQLHAVSGNNIPITQHSLFESTYCGKIYSAASSLVYFIKMPVYLFDRYSPFLSVSAAGQSISNEHTPTET